MYSDEYDVYSSMIIINKGNYIFFMMKFIFLSSNMLI